MSDLRRCLDDSNLYFTNIISKNGRNEVQIFPINKKASESIILDSLIVKIELQADEIVTSCCWINNSGINNSERAKKRGKRRQSSSESDLNEATSDNKNLAVALENGDILILSPLHNDIIDRISYGHKIISLTPSLIHDSVWGVLEESRSIVEISLAQSKEVKNFKFKEDEQIQSAKTIRQTGGSSRSQHILIGSNNLYLVDPSKPKKSLLTTFPQISEASPISIIEQSRLKENLVVVVRENENQIYLYNTSDSTKFSTFKTSTSQIYGVQLIANTDMTEELLMAVTAEGVEVFKIDFDSNHEEQIPTCLIKTNFHDSIDNIIFMDVFLREKQSLIGVWYNGNEPKFENINWNFNSAGEIQVSIDYNEKVNGVVDNRIDDIEFPETTKINNLAVNKLYKDLIKLLNVSKKITEEKVIRLCSSNNDDDNIKETIKLFSTSESSSALITKLFEIISKEVASQPSKNSALSVWLKWLLLVHGGFIAKQPDQHDNLKTLQTGLTEGMKLMPRLLGLQGRLQLLKSQTQLRDNLNNMSIESDDEEDKELTDIMVNNDDSENITIANGESDDFEEADVASFAIDAEADDEDEDKDEEEAEEED